MSKGKMSKPFCCISLQSGTKLIALIHMVGCMIGIILLGIIFGVNMWTLSKLNNKDQTRKPEAIINANFPLSIEIENTTSFINPSKTVTEHFTIEIMNSNFVFIRNNNTKEKQTYMNIKISTMDETYELVEAVFLTLICIVALMYAVWEANELWAGVNERNYWRCVPWLRVQIASLSWFVLTCLNAVLCELFVFKIGTYFSLLLATSLPVAMAGMFINVYFLWVVHSFTKQLKVSESNRNFTAVDYKDPSVPCNKL